MLLGAYGDDTFYFGSGSISVLPRSSIPAASPRLIVHSDDDDVSDHHFPEKKEGFFPPLYLKSILRQMKLLPFLRFPLSSPPTSNKWRRRRKILIVNLWRAVCLSVCLSVS